MPLIKEAKEKKEEERRKRIEQQYRIQQQQQEARDRSVKANSGAAPKLTGDYNTDRNNINNWQQAQYDRYQQQMQAAKAADARYAIQEGVNRGLDLIGDTMRGSFRGVADMLGGAHDHSAEDLATQYRRYQRDLDFYSRAAQDARNYKSQELYDRAASGLANRTQNYNDAYSRYVSAQDRARDRELKDLQKTNVSAYYGETMNGKQIQQKIDELQKKISTIENMGPIWTDGMGGTADAKAADVQKRYDELQDELTRYKAAQRHRNALDKAEEMRKIAEDITGNANFKTLSEVGRSMLENRNRQARESVNPAEYQPDDPDDNRQFAKAMRDEQNALRTAGYVEDLDSSYIPEDVKPVYYALYAQNPQKAREWAEYWQGVGEGDYWRNIYEQSGEDAGSRLGAFIQGTFANIASGFQPFGEGGQYASKLGKTMIGGGAAGLTEKGLFNSGKLAGEIDVPIFGKQSLGNAYQLGSSMLQSLANATLAKMTGGAAELVGGLGTIMMGSSAAASDYQEKLEQGWDETSAKVHAFFAGAAEWFCEKYSLESLINQNVARGFFKNFALQGLAEGSEEGFTTLANLASDKIIAALSDNESDLQRRRRELIEQGYERGTAEKMADQEWLTELMNDIGGGFVSGGLMSSGQYAMYPVYKAMGAVETRRQNERTGALSSRTGEAAALAQYAADNNLEWASPEQLAEAVKPGAGGNESNLNESTLGRQVTDAAEQKKTRQELRQERKANRQTGEDVNRARTHIQEQLAGKTVQEQQAIRDELVKKYGSGMEMPVYRAVSMEAAKQAMQLESTDAIRQARETVLAEIQDEDMKRAVAEGYDQAAYQMAAQNNDLNAAAKYIQQVRNTGTGEMRMEATVEGEDGQSKQVAITGMSEDGKSVVLADGVKIAVKDLQADADTMDALQQLVDLDLGSDADAALQAYRKSGVTGTEGYRWLMDYATAYNQGRTRQISLEEATKRSSLDERTVMDAYTLGQKSAYQETQKGLDRVASMPKREGATGRISNIDTSDIKNETMNDSEREQFEMANKYISMLGVDLKWFSSKEKNGRYVGKNGAYENGTVYMDIHAGRNFTSDLTSGIMATMSHELTHFQQQYAPKEYQALKEFLFQQIVKNSKNGELTLERLIWEKQKRSGNKLSRRQAEDEVVADACQKMLRDSRVAQEFAKENKQAANSIIQWLDKWFRKIKEVFGRGGNYSEEAQLMDSLEKDVKRAFGDLWDAGLREAVRVHDEVGNMSAVEKDATELGASDQMVEDALTQNSDRIDEETLEFLDNQEHVTVYRAMQLIDGELYPPMAAKVKDENGKLTLVEPTKIGQWYQAVERPDLIDPKTGKWRLNKGNGTAIDAAYNPYFHSSASPLNDQFSSAYKRDNLVVVEGKIPASELTSGYKAQYAKDSVGETKWHSGPVASQLKGDKARRVFLSRWFQATRIMPDAEVASIVAKTLEGENVAVPSNVVTPSLLAALKAEGVRIEEKNTARKDGVKFSNRNYSYSELTAKKPISGTVVNYSNVQKAFKADGTVNTAWLDNHILSQCKTVKTNAPNPTHYVEVADLGHNVEVTSKGINHGIVRKNKTYQNSGLLPVTTRENAIGTINLAETLANAIEVNILNGRGNPDVPYSHVLVGISAAENGNGGTDYYAVRFVVDERINQDPILTEANVLSKLFAANAKKLRSVNAQVAQKNVALAQTMPQFAYSITDMLSDVKDEFTDTFSTDVYSHFGKTRESTKFSDGEMVLQPDGTMKQVGGLQFSERSLLESAGFTAELNEDGLIVARDSDGKIIKHVTVDHIDHSGIGALINYAAQSTPFKRATISKADAEIQKQAAADLVNMVLKTNDAHLVWRFAGSALFSAVKSNSDGQYGTTIDFSTVCRKTQEMVTAMSEAMTRLKRGLTKDEVIELQKKILEENGTVPCPVCYVFSRWAGVGGILDNMYKFQQKYGHEYDDPAVLQARIRELEAATKTKADLRAALRQYDTIYMELAEKVENLQAENKTLNKQKPRGKAAKTEEGLAKIDEINKQVKANNAIIEQSKRDMKKLEDEGAPELAWLKRVRSADNYWETGNVPAEVLFNLDDAATFADKYSAAWGYRTTRGPSAGKAILPYSDMQLGDLIMGPKTNRSAGTTGSAFGKVEGGQFSRDQQKILRNALARVKAQNLIGGQRYQSTSDFRYDYGLDYLQSFWEAQALGSNMQTYTKIVEFAELVATIGGDVNLSVMPLNSGVDEDGYLIYSSVTGINAEAAIKISRMFDSAQLILVGINDEHILTALDDFSGKGGENVGFVIPYHASGASINRFIRGLVENLDETFDESFYKDYSPIQTDSAKKIKGANEDMVKEWMEAIRENPADPQFKGKKPTAAQRAALDKMFLAEVRQAILKHKIGSSREAATGLVERSLELIRGKSTDITGRSFEDLRAVEKRALAGDPAAIREYSSWSAGVLWDLYNKMWVDEKAEKTYGVELNTAQAHAIMPHEYWNKTVDRAHAYINGFIFRSYCYNLGLTPRFTGVDSAGKNIGYGDFSDSTGYWKTLIDRAMYANDGTYRDQQTINVTDVTKEMLTPEYGEEHWGEYKVREPQDVTARRAAEKFVAERQYSLRDYDNTLSDYDLIMGSDGEGLVGDQLTLLKETKERISRVQGLRNKLADTRAKLKAAEKKIAELEKPGSGKFAQQMRAAKAEAQLDIERAQGKDRLNRAVRTERDKLNETRRELRKTETKLANQIQREQDIITGKLKPPAMQRLLTDERRKAREKANQHKDEVFANYRERKNITALKSRIRNLTADIRKTAASPTERSFLPAHLAGAMVDLLDVLEQGQVDTPKAGTKAASKYYSATDAIRALADAYKQIENDPDYTYSSEFEQDVYDGIVKLANQFVRQANDGHKYNITANEMSLQELQQVYDTVREIREGFRNASKLIGMDSSLSTYDYAGKILGHQREIQEAKAGKKGKKLRSLYDNIQIDALSPIRAAHMMDGFQDAEFYQLWKQVEAGLGQRNRVIMDSTKRLQSFKTGQNELTYLKALREKSDYGIRDVNGKPVLMTKMQAIQMLMTWQREEANQNLVHMQEGGVIIRDADLISRGRYSDAKKTQQKVKVTPEMIQQIASTMTEWDKGYMKAARDVFSSLLEQSNKVLYTLKRKVHKGEAMYIPEKVAEGYLAQEVVKGGEFNLGVKEASATKDLKQKSTLPIIIDGLETMMNRHINDMANYIGLAVPIRNFAKVYNTRTSGIGVDATTVNDEITNTWGDKAGEMMMETLRQVQNGRSYEYQTVLSGLEQKIQSAFVKASLVGKISVFIKQAASYAAAGSVLSQKALDRSQQYIFAIVSAPNGKLARSVYNRIDALTPEHFIRRMGMSMEEIAMDKLSNGPIKGKLQTAGAWLEQKGKVGKALRHTGAMLNPTNWIQRMDVATTGALVIACEKQATYDGFKRGTPEFEAHVKELYERVIRETQPMYDPLHRPALQKNAGPMARLLFPFRTVPFQNYGQIMDSFGSFQSASKENKKAAAVHFGKTLWANFESALVFAALGMLSYAIMHKPKRYLDDDDELTLESLLKTYGSDVLDVSLGNLLPYGGTELKDFVERWINGDKWYQLISVGPADLVNDTASAILKLKEASDKLSAGEISSDGMKNQVISTTMQVTKLLGLPVSNVRDIFKGVSAGVDDWKNGRMLWLNDATVERNNTTNSRRYLKAWTADNPEKVDSVKAEMLRNYTDAGKSEEEANKALKSSLTSAAKSAFDDGTLEEQDTIDFLAETGFYSEDEAWKKVQEWAAKAEHEGEEDYKWNQYEDLREAFSDGAGIDEAIQILRDHGYTDKQLNDEISGNVRQLLNDGEIDEDTAIDYLTEYAGKDEDKAWRTVQGWQGAMEHADEEDYSWGQYDAIDEALAGNKDIKALVQELTDHGVKEKNVSDHIKGQIIQNYVDGKTTESALKNQLSRYLGIVAKDDVDKILKDANSKKQYGVEYSKLDEEYRAGKIKASDLKAALMKYGGLSAADAEKKIRWYDLQKANPSLEISESKANTWYDGTSYTKTNGHESAKAAGMSIQDYLRAKDELAKVKGVDANNDGRTDTGSREIAYIQALTSMSWLTDRQRRALYYEEYKGTSKTSGRPW